MKDCDSSKQEADHYAKNLPITAWLMTIFQAKNTTVGIVATCSRRGPDIDPYITAEIAYYTHGLLITQNCQWKYLLRPTASKIAITHHHQLLLQETAWPTGLSGWRTSDEPLRTQEAVLLCFINPRVRKIRNEASSCPEIFSRTFRRATFTMSLAPPVHPSPIFLSLFFLSCLGFEDPT